MTPHPGAAPDWDLEQLAVILESPASWQLISAGPGTGKSAVACQRVAYLVDEGLPPSRLLLVSFTRTAVAELRDRIISYAVAGERASGVRISTIDSHAWSLRTGFDDEPFQKALCETGYDLSIARTVELFRQRQPELYDFMGRLEHLIVDEAQDVLGIRADLIIEMLRSLGDDCGVTILADPAQAIFGFTAEDGETIAVAASLLARLDTECPRPLLRRTLNHIHRIKNPALIDVFRRTRTAVEGPNDVSTRVARVQEAIREACGKDVGVTSYSEVADALAGAHDKSLLVLFRRRADVLFASSYCSSLGVTHRLRMSGLPVVVAPWLGWLFGECTGAVMGRDEFDALWQERGALAPAAFDGEHCDQAWDLLHRLVAARSPRTIDLVQLHRLLARARPPVELCHPELGTAGPILGTIHASKGREADNVMLIMAPPDQLTVCTRGDSDSAVVAEEARVYYVGATRARQVLVAARNTGTPVGYLDSSRVYRTVPKRRAQLEIGRHGDVDRLAHLGWANSRAVQRALASSVGSSLKLRAWSVAERRYSWLLSLEDGAVDGVTEIGQLSESFGYDWKRLWGRIDGDHNLKPPDVIPHLYLFAVSTIGLSEGERGAVTPPFNHSGIALVPIVKGFPTVQFYYRRRRNYS